MKTNCIPYSGRLIFDHLPKAAGTSIQKALEDQFGNAVVFSSYLGDNKDLISRYGGDYSILAGHIWFRNSDLDARYKYVTLLREPVERVCSWIKYILLNHADSEKEVLKSALKLFIDSDGDLYDENTLWELNNYYIRHFSEIGSGSGQSSITPLDSAFNSVCRYDLIGFFDELNKFCVDFGSLLQCKLTVPFYNKTKEDIFSQVEFSDKLLKKIHDLNAEDIEFYKKTRSYVSTICALDYKPNLINYKKIEKQKISDYISPLVHDIKIEVEGDNFVQINAAVNFIVSFSLDEKFDSLVFETISRDPLQKIVSRAKVDINNLCLTNLFQFYLTLNGLPGIGFMNISFNLYNSASNPPVLIFNINDYIRLHVNPLENDCGFVSAQLKIVDDIASSI